jgi:hypothetical protein
MTTADWALVISLFAVTISAASFVWNVWSKFIYPKPKVKTHFAVREVHSLGRPPFSHIGLNATNYGPGAVTLYAAICRPRLDQGSLPLFLRRRLGLNSRYILLNPLSHFPADTEATDGPFSGGLPKKLDVGESFSASFVYKHDGLRDTDIIDVGFDDTFGRDHWVPRYQVRAVLVDIRETFPASKFPRD